VVLRFTWLHAETDSQRRLENGRSRQRRKHPVVCCLCAPPRSALCSLSPPSFSFIQTHNLNTAEILVQPPTAFPTFNAFFYRKLRPGARACHAPADPFAAVSPADCRLMVFDTLEEAKRLWIKGVNFSLPNLFAAADPSGQLAHKFLGGSLAICRLAPQVSALLPLPLPALCRPLLPSVRRYALPCAQRCCVPCAVCCVLCRA
jgi:hypothetical protein